MESYRLLLHRSLYASGNVSSTHYRGFIELRVPAGDGGGHFLDVQCVRPLISLDSAAGR